MKPFSLAIIALLFLLCACNGEREHTAESLGGKDSMLFMRSKGISTLISDSGIVRYRLVAEDWDVVNDTIPGRPATWKFLKGALLQRLDSNQNIDMYATADTVYYYEQHLWEMRGRVVIHTKTGTLIRSEELFYDDQEHYMWSNLFTHFEQPDKEIDGYTFRSNDQMTDYIITNTRGSFDRKDNSKPDAPTSPDTQSPTNPQQ